jgi:glycerol kinase
VVRPVVQETTALGAACLAGLTINYWKNIDEVEKCWAIDRRYTPAMEAEQCRKLYAGWQKAIDRSSHWADE